MLWMLISLGWSSVNKTLPPKKKKEVCSVVPSEDEMFMLAKQYYERHGIWAGIFFLSSAQKQRIVHQEGKDVVYHLQYAYTPVPGNNRGRNDSGWDQRTFLLQCKTGWYVEQMGTHMSAQLP